MNPLKHYIIRNALVVLSPFVLLTTASSAAGVKIVFAGDSDVGEGGRWTKARAEEWAQKTGNTTQCVSLLQS